MLLHAARCLGSLALFLVLLAEPAFARQTKQTETADLNTVSMEVNALQTLQNLNLTDAQVKKLQVWAKETAEKPRQRTAAQASKEYRDKLLELRDALIDGTDSDRIDLLTEELDDLRETEKPTIDDGVEITAAAGKRAPEMFRLLKVQQLAGFLDTLRDGLVDPLDRLLEGLSSCRALRGNEWKQRREELVDDIVRVAAGIDSNKADKLVDAVTILLSQAHAMSDADFKAKRAKLEKAARKLLGDVSTLDVMRNATEYALAELLSNPGLAAVLEARLKK